MTTAFASALRNLCSAAGLNLPEDRLEKLSAYYGLLEEANRRVNLTADMSPEEMAGRHFLDALALPALRLLPESGRILDVGSGAGFPGLPLAIMRNDLSVVLLDSIGKKTAFLQSVIDALGLSNVCIVTARAEDYARAPGVRESFDAALSRAVAPLNVLLEYALPFVRVGGASLAWKGPQAHDEIRAAAKAIRVLGGGEAAAYAYSLPGRGDFHIVEVKKIRQTPMNFPRKAGKPSSVPIE